MRLLIAELEAAEGQDSELESALRNLVAHSRGEPGTMAYGVHRAGSSWVVVECYRDQAAVEAHLNSSALQRFIGQVPTLLSQAPVLKFYDSVDGFGFGETR